MSRLFCSVTSAQQQIALAVSRGSHYWFAGEVPIEKYPALAAKFKEKHGTELSRGTRGYRQTRKLGNASLVACHIGGWVKWWVLLTEGKHPAWNEEQVRDAREKGERLTFDQDYVLIYSTRPKVHGGGSRWTWFLTRECEKGDARMLAKLAQQGSERDVQTFCETLLRRPLHSGVRSQTAAMIRRAIAIWRKHHPYKAWPGVDPSRLPFMTFKKATPLPTPSREDVLQRLERAFARLNASDSDDEES